MLGRGTDDGSRVLTYTRRTLPPSFNPADRQEDEVRSFDAEFKAVHRADDGWCGPIVFADERSADAFEFMAVHEEPLERER